MVFLSYYSSLASRDPLVSLDLSHCSMNTFAMLSTQYVDGKFLFNNDKLTSNYSESPIITKPITSIPHHIAALRSRDDLESKVLDRQA